MVSGLRAETVTSYSCKLMMLSTQSVLRKYVLREPERKVPLLFHFTDKEMDVPKVK